MNDKKTLKVYGQCEPLGEMPCQRVRAVLTDDHGQRIFFAADGWEKPRERRYRKYFEMPWEVYGSTDWAYIITDDPRSDDPNSHALPQQKRQGRPWQLGNFEFTPAGLLEYINTQFHTSYDKLDIDTGRGRRKKE
jgi:hypothetical protein